MAYEKHTEDDSVYILDSYGLIYRAYFALINHPLTNKNGQNISALVIFFRNLQALLAHYKPKYLAAAFDSRTPTFRHQMYAEYKATRQKTPEDLLDQVPWIEETLNALGVPVLRVDGYEADDIIATVAKECKKTGRHLRILSGDKDLLQLVDDTCLQMQPDKANGGWETNGRDEVLSKWGIGPEKILDYLSLVGDSADNVPGVKGVGDKTALKLLSEYGTLDGIYEHSEEIKGALGNKIRDDKENAYFSKQLITLCDTVPIQIDFESFGTQNLNYAGAADKLEAKGAMMAAKSFRTRALNAPQSDAPDTDASDDTETKPLSVTQNSGDYTACTNAKNLTKIIDDILSSKEKSVAFDTETNGLNAHAAQLVGFSLCSQKGKAVYVPVILPGGMFAPETVSAGDALTQLARLFSNADVTVIMHNAKFDLEVLSSNAGRNSIPFTLNCKLRDTMLAAWLVDSDAQGKSPYSLEYLGETKLGLKGIEFKDVVEKGQTFADVPLEKAVPYGAEDADFTWQLWQYYEPLLTKRNLNELYYNMEIKVLPILTNMEIAGIHIDKKVLADYSVELAKEIKSIEKKIYKTVGHEFNIASTKQLQTVLFEERGLAPGKKTKTGYSTDTAVLEELSERTDDPLPQLILDYRSYTKLQSTYVETLPTLADSHDRIHTSFLQTGTATGRLSSRDPNLQNIPIRDEAGRRIRSAFTATEGTELISADYAQIELVVLAHLSGDKNLRKAFIDGIDVHRSTAALIYGIAPEDVSAEQRRFAKTVNFGVMYGMSAFRLSNELGITRTHAKDFIDQYFTTYADVKRFLNDTIENAKHDGYVQTLMGRRREIPDINNANKLIQQGAQRIAINTPIQGSAADIVKTAMCKVQDALTKSGSKARMLLQVHDELIFECPSDSETVEKTISLIRENMENAVQLSVPLRVSIEHGANWGEFH
ncbi:MAG: DNA polymerase I [Treponema sp.]|nr:DNA polymerase I [Treponema sp.]